MRKSILFLFVVLLIVATSAFAQGGSTGRAAGVVTDEDGKPIQGAKVILSSEKSGTKTMTTDKNGKWAAVGLIGGTWNIDIEAEGFQTERGTMQISELQRVPPQKTTMVRIQVKTVTEETVTQKPGIPQEAVDAINTAQAMLDEVEGRVLPTEELTEERKKVLWTGAISNFDKALELIPDDADNAKTRIQIVQVLAQAHYKSGNLDKAIEMLKKVIAANPENTGVQMLLANLLLENGRLDEGKTVLANIPPGVMTEPTAYINVGILLMNKAQLKDAYVYLNKAVELDPNRGESYYYRGLNLVQQQKLKEAKADLEKVVALAPQSSEAKDAQDILKQIK